MRISTLLALAACMVSTSLLAAEDHGCTLQQWQADDQFTLNGGAITQMFMPCQSGILEYVAIGAQSASTTSFGARLKVYEMDNGIQTLIHQQQGVIPGSEDAYSTVFSLSRNIPVNAEREYFLEVDIPEGRAMSFQYSGLDVYDEGELTVNHARFRGDLAFEVGVNPREIYDLETRAASPILRTWSTGGTAPEHACSVTQSKYNGVELLAEGAWSQTFSSCYTGDLESIWFQGEILQAETGVPVYIFERQSGDFLGAAELSNHPERQRTLTAEFGNLEVKAGREYEFFIECSESQQVDIHVIRNRSFFVGEFRHAHQVQDANLSFMAFVTDNDDSGVDAAWPYDEQPEHADVAVDVAPLDAQAGVKVTLQEDLEGNVTVGLFNVLGQMVEERNFNSPTAGTEVVFLTPNDNDQEYYSVRIVNDHALVVDSVYRR